MRRWMTILSLLGLVAVLADAQTYPRVTIRQVQEVPDSVLNLVNPNTDSQHLGDTLWVRGVVATAPRLASGQAQWFTGDRWRFIMKDPADSAFNHITVVASDTTFFRDSVGIDQVTQGDSIEVLGVITEFRTLTQLEVLRSRNVMNLLGTSTASFNARVHPMTDFFSGTSRVFNPAEKHESGFVRFENLTVIGINNFEFTVADAAGNRIVVDDQSTQINFDGSTGVTPPVIGAKLDWVQGYIFTNSALDWTVNPRAPSDYKVGPFPPTFDRTERSPRHPGPNDAVTVSSTVYDTDGTVASVSLYYWVNGTPYGPIAMVAGPDSVWSATVPAVGVDSALVQGFVKAVDNEGNVSTDPGTADSADATKERGFFFVLNRAPRIKEIQYNPWGGGSSYAGDTLTVSGIATSDRKDYGAIFIQDGTGKWSGVRISSPGDSAVIRGDSLTVTGVVAESFTQTIIQNSTITVKNRGNQLPAATVVTTSGVQTNGADAEAYESVLIQVDNVYVVNINEDAVSNSNFGEFGLSEDITKKSGLRVDDYSSKLPYTNDTTRSGQAAKVQLHVRDFFQSVRGILHYSFSHFKLIPRDTADFTGYQNIFTSVEAVDDVPAGYVLSQNYPNPFNPSTVIEYSIAREEQVTLHVYNVLGQLVGTAVNAVQPAGSYRVTLGADFFAGLSSGMYFYKVQAGSFVSARKMLLIR